MAMRSKGLSVGRRAAAPPADSSGRANLCSSDMVRSSWLSLGTAGGGGGGKRAVDDDDDVLTSTPTSHSPVFSMIGCIGDTLARARTARVSMGASKKVSAAMMPSKPSPSPLPCTFPFPASSKNDSSAPLLAEDEDEELFEERASPPPAVAAAAAAEEAKMREGVALMDGAMCSGARPMYKGRSLRGIAYSLPRRSRLLGDVAAGLHTNFSGGGAGKSLWVQPSQRS
jgi:hypothetical protein